MSRNLGLFERDKEGQRKNLSRSSGYGENLFAPARRRRSQKGQIAAKIVLPPSLGALTKTYSAFTALSNRLTNLSA